MNTVAVILLILLVVVLRAAVVGLVFVWGAIKDGEEDKAVQPRLGIRRRRGWAAKQRSDPVRPSEAPALRWGDVQERTVVVERSLSAPSGRRSPATRKAL